MLAGNKTQTRRAVKLQPDAVHGGEPYWFIGGYRAWPYRSTSDVLRKGGDVLPCPYGQAGDRLWVREAWKAHPQFDHLPPREILMTPVWYIADDGYKAESRYRQAMFMPSWVSRITLQITDVRVERLQDISAADCWAEGIQGQPPPGVYIESLGEIARWSDGVVREHPQPAYRALWEQINGAGSWD
ncbi:MAG: hypothetical protein KAX77_04985, partial [Xanthomonadales bacterium]|nr:hypothetical protein [Xanthomonadales bacterium]